MDEHDLHQEPIHPLELDDLQEYQQLRSLLQLPEFQSLLALEFKDPQEFQKLRTLLQQPQFQPLLALQQLQSAIHTKSITDQMPGGFFIYRADGDEELLYANEALLRLFGCEDLQQFKDLTGYTFKGMVHPEDYAQVEKSIWEQIEASHFDLDYVEYRITQRDGSVRWIEDYGHFVRNDATGDLFYVFVADATDKRQAQLAERQAMLEAANRELRRRLKIIEGFSMDYESIFYADLDADEVQPYQLSHRAMPEVYVMGRTMPFRDFARPYIQTWVHPEDREKLLQVVDVDYIRRRLDQERSFYVNYRIVEGERTPFLQLRISNVDSPGHCSQIVLGFRSVDSEISREAEQREVLETALRKANAAVEAKNTFLSNMSHDIRTPLNAVVGYTALARKNLSDPEKLKGFLEQVETAASWLQRLIEDVLELSRIEAGQSTSSETLCDLTQVLHAVHSSVQEEAARKGIQISQSSQDLQHPQVYVDRPKLEQALVRLVSNAVKYTPAGGHVRLTVAQSGAPTRDYALYTFTVEDDGIGMDSDFLERVFDPFERQRSTTLSGVPGMGLGLTIARSMVELMGGTLTVESTVDQGSRFTIALSLRVRDHAPVQAAATVQRMHRILLVEDNEINRELCAELLREVGFEVETAENGLEAVEAVRSSRPGDFTLVLMDIQMPVMDGNLATRAIRALEDPDLAAIPIVALSANALEEDRKKSMESGMNAHLAKPIQIDQLLHFLKSFSGETPD